MIKSDTVIVSNSLPQRKLKKEIKELRKLGEQTRKKFGFKTEDELYEYIHGD